MNDINLLPGPVFEQWEWQFEGACRQAEPTLFFHPDGERGPSKRRRDDAAKAICAGCPVLSQCRAHALSVREPYGVWGGLTEEERDMMVGSTARRRRSTAA